MNLPNLITLVRILLVPVFLFAFLAKVKMWDLVAAAIFILAAATDGVDGYLARKNNEVTRLGKFLDPLADKLLISTALVALVEYGYISTWAAMVIIGREMAVTGLRAIAAADGTIIAAGPWGKVKTVVQIIFIVATILSGAPLLRGNWLQTLAAWLFTPLLWAAMALTVWSGVDYALAYIRGLRSGEPKRRLKFKWRLALRRRGANNR